MLAVLLIAAIFGVKFWYDINNPSNLFDSPPLPTEAPEAAAATETDATPTPTAEPTPTPNPEDVLLPQSDLDFMHNRVNILLLGIDESTEREDWGSFRTDTMILVSINFDDNSVDMISVPRDSFVKLYTANGSLCSETEPYGKINSAFSKGGGAQKNGYGYAMTTVSKLMGGIPVGYYVCVNMNAVKAVVDAMGGVDYDVDVLIEMNGRTLETGYQHLDGQQVLDYCRMRHADSDLHRIDRQQRMLMAILSQLKSSGQIANIPSIYSALQANIATNLSFAQISSLALIASRMDMEDLSRYTVEATGVIIDEKSCLAVYASRLKELVYDVFGVKVTIDPEIDAEYIKTVIAPSYGTVTDATVPYTIAGYDENGAVYYYDENGNLIISYETPAPN